MHSTMGAVPIPMKAAALMLGLSLFAGALGADDVPNFNGTWKENAELSQPWREKFDQVFGPRPQTRELPRQGVWDRVQSFLKGLPNMEVEQTASEIKVVTGDDVRIFYFGRTHIRQTPGGAKVTASCRFDGPSLVVEERTAAGLTLVEIFTLRDAGTQLSHVSRFTDPSLKEAFVLSRVYDRVAH